MKKAIASIVISGCILNLAGCSTSRYASSPQKDIKSPLYASIEKSENGWYFNQISDNHERLEGIKIDLASGYPVWGIDTRSRDCKSLWWNAYYGGRACPKGEFRSADMTAKTIPSYLLGGLVTFGFGWIAGWASLKSNFDWDEYNDAIEEAYDNSNIDKSTLPAISERLAELSSLIEGQNIQCETFRPLRRDFSSDIISEAERKLRKISKVNNTSGLYFNAQFYPGDYISLHTEAPKIPYLPECGNNTVKKHSYSTKNTNILNTIESEIEQIKANTQLIANKIIEAKQTLANAESLIEISCKDITRIDSFYAELKCEKSILRSELNRDNIQPKAIFTITGKDIKNVLPKSYRNNDKRISVELDDRKITIENLTDEYITYEKISIYHNNQIISTNGYELPPRSYKNMYMGDFNTSSFHNDYYNITKEKAASINIDFGISLKYKITGKSEAQALHKIKRYTLSEII